MSQYLNIQVLVAFSLNVSLSLFNFCLDGKPNILFVVLRGIKNTVGPSKLPANVGISTNLLLLQVVEDKDSKHYVFIFIKCLEIHNVSV